MIYIYIYIYFFFFYLYVIIGYISWIDRFWAVGFATLHYFLFLQKILGCQRGHFFITSMVTMNFLSIIIRTFSIVLCFFSLAK
ncbi:hypothetical protein U3516DRAFT_228659 [Neocallimastix sp. 'constans']